ncbi:hypothetical protein [Halobacterium yunchengense]|uniref:hypothetical protein n=1 Tax=Halobacterium yunchengense TaxID=3108497 RepID=UPI00300BC71F
MGAFGETESVRAALADAVRARDAAALALVPAVACGVFLLPPATRRRLAFAYDDPTAVTAYTNHVVHFGVEHLAANVLGFALLAGSGYVLAALAGHRRLFGAAAATYLVAFPPVLSALNLVVGDDALGYGLSGVNMAFEGLLGLVVVAYARQRLDGRVRVRHAPAVFFAATAAVAVLALPPGRWAAGIAAASAVVAAGYVASARSAWRDATPSPAGGRAESLLAQTGWLDVGVLAGVVFAGYLAVGFPAPVGGDGVVVNLYVHLLGFSLGFSVPYVALELGAFEASGGE